MFLVEIPKKLTIIKVKGKPYEMGKQHGKQVKELLGGYKELIDSIYEKANIPEDKIIKLSSELEDGLSKYSPEILDEMRGMADGAKVKYEDIIKINLAWEIMMISNAISTKGNKAIEQGCSCYAAVGNATLDGKPILGENQDMSPIWGKYMILVFSEPFGGNKLISTTFPGSAFLAGGINEKGIAQAGSSAGTLSDCVNGYQEGKSLGLSLCSIYKLILERSNNIDEAIEYTKINPKGFYGANRIIVDKDNNMVRCEMSYEKTNIVYPEVASYESNYVMASAGAFSSREMNPLCMGQKPPKRYDRIMELLTFNAGKINFDVFKAIARDHANGPSGQSICRHGPDGYSMQAIIIQPSDNRLWLVKGTPCQGRYVEYKL